MEQFYLQMQNGGYKRLNGCEPGVNILYIVDNEMPYVVSFIDCEMISTISEPGFMQIEGRIREAFLKAGYRYIRLLNIYITSQVDRIKYANSRMQTPFWIIDKATKEIIVYENQPDEFRDLRPGLERYLYGEVMPKSTRLKKKSFLTINNLIILINILVFIVTAAGGNVYDASYIEQCGGVYPELVFEDGQIYRLFTCMFLHFGIMHLAGNMLFLYFIGNMYERYTSHLEYALVYFIGGLSASFISCVFYYIFTPNTVSAGASGAILAIVGGLIAVALFDRKKKFFVKSSNIILLAVFTIGNGLFDAGVDNLAHISGLITGFLVSLVLILINKRRSIL